MSDYDFKKVLGMTATGKIEENTNHTIIFNLKRNLEQCRDELIACKEELIACKEELIACRANNNNFIKQIEFLTSEGGRKRKKTRRKRRKKTKRKRRKKTKRSRRK